MQVLLHLPGRDDPVERGADRHRVDLLLDDLDLLVGALGRDPGLGELGLDLVLHVLGLRAVRLVFLHLRGSTAWLLAFSRSAISFLSSFWSSLAVEPGDQVALLDPLAMVDGDLDDDAGDRGVDGPPLLGQERAAALDRQAPGDEVRGRR